MPLDFSIYNRFQPQQPDWDGLGQSLQQAGATYQRNKLTGLLQSGDYEKAALIDPQAASSYQELMGKNALNKAYAANVKPDGTIDYGALTNTLAQSGQGAQVPAILKAQREQEKADREAQGAKIKLGIDQLSASAQVLGGARDQAGWDAARTRLASMGVDVSDMPPQFDPAWQQSEIQQAMTVAERLAERWKQQNFALEQERFGETKRHNRTQEGISAANAAAYRANLDQTRQGKPTYDAERGVIVDPVTGVARPVTLADGGALPTKKTTMGVDAKRAETTLRGIDKTLSDYEALVTTHGPQIAPGKPKGQLTGAYANLQMELKNLYELGALTGPDVEVLGRMITPPDALTANLNPYAKEQMLAQLKEAKKTIKEKKEAFGATYGIQFPDAGGPGGGPARISGDADYNALPSGAEFIAPDGSRRRKP